MVYVISHTGVVIMPTARHGKVRRMLRDGLARVVRLNPFTIQLLYENGEFVQPIALGVDAGTGHVGLSATTEKKELFAAEVTLRRDIVDLISTRREVRRSRRNRKTRYRAARFNNRERPAGWLAPSVEQSVDSHLALIRLVHSILPVSRTTIEVGQFDTQLMQNPDIQGEEYQQGPQLGFWNVREYVLFRDNHECQHCHGKSKDPVLNVHHIESRKTGGNAPGNLITLCETCHKAYHRGDIVLDIKRRKPFRDATKMSIMRWAIYERAKAEFGNIRLTYGYITKHTRIFHNLEKSHSVDARCISGNALAEPCKCLMMRQRRRHNRQLFKANTLKGDLRKRNQAPYLVKGFRLFDKVYFNGKECFIFARRASGFFDIRKFNGEKVKDGISYKKLKFKEISRRYLITFKEKGCCVSSPD